MKKIAALVLVEIIIILTLLLAMNMFIFRRVSVSFFGVIFMFRMAARSGFRMVSFKVIAFLFVVVVFFTVQLVFMYQAVRKAVLDFRNRNRHSSGTARWATTRELKKLGLISKEPDGVILGQSKDAKGVIMSSQEVTASESKDSEVSYQTTPHTMQSLSVPQEAARELVSLCQLSLHGKKV